MSAAMTTTRNFTTAGSNTAPFCPIFRAHRQPLAQRGLVLWQSSRTDSGEYLKLRYQIMPYIYSLAYRTHESGLRTWRALFMDFPVDPKVAGLGDEYMFGSAFLVAPSRTGSHQSERFTCRPARIVHYWTTSVSARGQKRSRFAAPI